MYNTYKNRQRVKLISRIHWFHLWAGISLFTILSLVIFNVQILFAPESIQVQYIPNDAFW